MDAGELPAGPTRLQARFSLPAGLPPTHHHAPAWATLELAVRVVIPWWPDGRYRFDLSVRIPAPAVVERRPVAVRSTPLHAAPDAARLEVSLASTALVAGESVVGSCAIYHVDDRKPRELELALVPRLELFGGRTRTRDADAVWFRFTLPAGFAGTNLPFRFEMPHRLAPTFQAATHRLRWFLMARSGSFFGGRLELSIPIEIFDASAAALVPRLAAAPRLADQRVEEVFDRVAERDGWQRVVADGDGAIAITRTFGDAVAQLTYDYRGEAGTFVVARIDHPPLGLDLNVTPSSALRHVFFADIEVDIEAWDRRHHVSARDAGQTVVMLRQAVPALSAATALGELRSWHDDAVVFERATATLDAAELSAMGSALATLAPALAAAALAIAPPPGIAIDLAAWRQLAHGLGGRATLGDLSIEGHLDRTRVALGLEWRDGEPAGIRVAVGDPADAGDELRAIAFTLVRPREEVMTVAAAGPLVEQVLGWPDDFVELRVEDGVASASWALPAGEPPTVEPARVRALVEALRAALAVLVPGTGPYR
jgi:hypothetical protein